MANKAKQAVQAVETLAKVGRLAKAKVPQTELQRRQGSQYAAMRAQLSPTFQSKRDEQTQREQVEAYVHFVTNLASPYVKDRFAKKIAQTLALIKAGEIMGSAPASKVKGGKAKK